jgi:hypothetical protein
MGGYDRYHRREPRWATVHGAITYKVDYYEHRECDDYMLWEYLKEDFEDWTKETFLAHPELVRDFRDFLRENGCWVLTVFSVV